ncbi:hypothetical protein F2Q69_00007190 [Brassica cretica]|uniref:Uncharacterized protein n=1 Tax=Brassica cretica TaxID=69181 RepID=A0A8S9PI73_BRACR|nr:hypothetical protein F2Q69_00007190 [Brassica cretica]
MTLRWAETTPTSRGGDGTVAPKSRLCVRHDEVARTTSIDSDLEAMIPSFDQNHHQHQEKNKMERRENGDHELGRRRRRRWCGEDCWRLTFKKN